MKYYLLIFLMWAGCSNPAPRSGTNGAYGNSEVAHISEELIAELGSLSLDELKVRVRDLGMDVFRKKLDLRIAKRVVTDLCEKNLELRQACLVKNPIAPDGGATLCSQEDGDWTPPPFKMSLPPSVSTPVKLVINDVWVSHQLSPGADQEIEFSTDGLDGLAPPAFSEIVKAVIQPATAGSQLPPIAQMEGFGLAVGDTSLGSELLPGSGANARAEYLVNVSPIIEQVRSESCSLTTSDVDGWKQAITQSENNSSAADQERELSKVQQINARDQLTLAYSEYQKELEEVLPELAREQGNVFNLSQEMLGQNTQLGCHLKSDLTKLEIELQGEWLDRVEYQRDAEQQMENGADAARSSQLRVAIGPVEHAFNTKSVNPFGQKVVIDQDFTGIKVGALKKVIILKLGVKYDNQRFTTSRFWGLDQQEKFNIYELDVYSLTGVKIWANDNLIFSDSGVDVTLQGFTKYSVPIEGRVEHTSVANRRDCQQSF